MKVAISGNTYLNFKHVELFDRKGDDSKYQKDVECIAYIQNNTPYPDRLKFLGFQFKEPPVRL